MQMKITRLFYESQRCSNQILLHRGGARSSKSYSIAQLITIKFLQETNKKILILRKTLPSLRISTLPVMKEIWNSLDVFRYIKEEKQTLDYHFKTNWLHFGSLDSPEKIKSSDWNYVWMEECNEFTYDDFITLKLRLSAPSKDNKKNQLYLSFNPMDSYCWMKERVIDEPSEDKKEIVSNYLDNPFLSDDYIKTILALKQQDANFWRIFGLGEWGVLENLIYGSWSEIDVLPEGGETIYGLDFGFSQPSALVEIRLKEEEVFLKQLIFQEGLTNSALIERMQQLIPDKSKEIFADTAEPNRIEEIFQAGFNIHPSDKSVKDGIDYVKRQKISVTSDSPDIIKERRSYSYKKDKSNRILDDPIKFNDHSLDAIRYGLYTHSKQLEPSIRWL